MSDYQFPPTTSVSNSVEREWWHLLLAVLRVGVAILRRNAQDATVATWYVRQEGETLHRILSGRGADVGMAREEVMSECLEHGRFNVGKRSG